MSNGEFVLLIFSTFVLGCIIALIYILVQKIRLSGKIGQKKKGKVHIHGTNEYKIKPLELVDVPKGSVDGSNATDEYLNMIIENKDGDY